MSDTDSRDHRMPGEPLMNRAPAVSAPGQGPAGRGPATIDRNRPDAASSAGLPVTDGTSVNMAVARHGRSRPRPPPASSTRPYLASCRRWNEQLAELSPTSSPARVAVSGPSERSSPSKDSRKGCASARSARGSVIRLTDRGCRSAMNAKLSFERYLCKMSYDGPRSPAAHRDRMSGAIQESHPLPRPRSHTHPPPRAGGPGAARRRPGRPGDLGAAVHLRAHRATSRLRGAVQDRRLVPDRGGPGGREAGHRVLTPAGRRPRAVSAGRPLNRAFRPAARQRRYLRAQIWVTAAVKP